MGEKPQIDPQTTATENVKRLYEAMRLRRTEEASGRFATGTVLDVYISMGQSSLNMPNEQ
jgi:hypothetical protein